MRTPELEAALKSADRLHDSAESVVERDLVVLAAEVRRLEAELLLARRSWMSDLGRCEMSDAEYMPAFTSASNAVASTAMAGGR